ncbi:MAG: hypothetical protein RL398_154 [Planctomycetota bacterium]
MVPLSGLALPYSTMPTLRSLLACCLLAVPSVLRAQATEEESTRHTVNVDSGLVTNTNRSPSAVGVPDVVWSTVVGVPGAAWVRLEYKGILLSGARDRGADGSFLRITSLLDNQFQTQHLVHVEQWQNTSAYFNGDAVLVELLACPGTGFNRVSIGTVIAGPLNPVGDDSICGPTDDRVLSYDQRAARMSPTGCTVWMIDDCSKCFLTAGHCSGSGMQVVQFNVPLSTSSGSRVNPGPQDQYTIDQASIQTNGGQGTGNDWAYFGVFPNSTTGLHPYQANGGQAYHLIAPPAVAGQNIRITGYGSTSSPVSPTWNLVQKTHSGPYASFSGTTVRYTTDTTGGNSGSPIIVDGTNNAIGIHTHGGCSSTGGSNIGTGSNHAALQAALNAPLGVCVCLGGLTITYPNGQPVSVPTDGTGRVRVQIQGSPGVNAATVVMHVDVGNGFVAVSPANLGGGIFEALVPAASCTSAVRYYWTASDTANAAFRDPEAAGTFRVTTAAASATTNFAFDFNTAPAGWLASNFSVSAGGWVRGTPNDVNGPAADADGSGQCWVTGNTNNEDLDGGPAQLRSGLMDVSTMADPRVRAALWFTCDTGEDRLLVEASQDFGITWTPVASLAPFVGWRMYDFRVRDYFATPGQLLVRYSVSDNPNNSNTEAALDAFAVVDATCPVGTWTSFGSGCAPTGQVPFLAPVTLPTLGTSFQLATTNLGSGAPFLAVGLAAGYQPLAAYGFGATCTAWVNPLTVVFAPGGSYALTIPNAPTLSGLRLYYQTIELGRAAVSNAGIATIR